MEEKNKPNLSQEQRVLNILLEANGDMNKPTCKKLKHNVITTCECQQQKETADLFDVILKSIKGFYQIGEKYQTKQNLVKMIEEIRKEVLSNKRFIKNINRELIKKN